MRGAVEERIEFVKWDDVAITSADIIESCGVLMTSASQASNSSVDESWRFGILACSGVPSLG